MTRKNTVQDVWRYVTVGDPDVCWPFTGCLNPNGYGQFKLGGRRPNAHRVAFQAARGEIPAGLVLDHLCRNRACCNPAHLEPVTYSENNRRGNTVNAANAAKTHCSNGHPFDETNTERIRGRRRCRACRPSERRRAYERRKAAQSSPV